MTYFEAVNILKKFNIELSEIKEFLSLFNFDINLIGINGDKEIDNIKFNKYLKLIKKEYPISYITNSFKSHGLNLYVDKNVLIPRTETIEFIYSYIKNNYDLNNKKVLDLCSGSGIISLSIKKLFPNSIITGSDISSKAIEIANINKEKNNLDVTYIKSNLFNKINSKFDMIITNPPYICNKNKIPSLKYEPKIALYANNNGLEIYERIFKDVDNYLLDFGVLCVELESNNSSDIVNLFKKYNPNYSIEIYKDIENKERYLIATKKNK